DHTHGIDDLRRYVSHHRRRIDVCMDAATSTASHARFDYCFATPEGSTYPPTVTEHRIDAGRPVPIGGAGGGMTARACQQVHGDTDTLGFRIGGLAYACDVSDIPNESLDALRDLDVWIVDALRYATHPSHFSLEQSLAWIERIRPRRAILTNLHSDLDY